MHMDLTTYKLEISLDHVNIHMAVMKVLSHKIGISLAGDVHKQIAPQLSTHMPTV